MNRRGGLTERLLGWLADDAEAVEGLVGDLREENERAGRSRAWGGVWFKAQLVWLAITYGVSRWPRRRRGATRRSRDSLLRIAGHELGLAVRSLVRAPRFATLAVLTLAIGIGATTAFFSLVHGMLLTPPAFPYWERMAYTPRMEESGVVQWYWSWQNYEDARELASSFELLEGVRLGSVVMTSSQRARRMFIRYVTPRFLEMYGAYPIRGRMFGPDDNRVPGGHPVVLITSKLWHNELGGDPRVVGKTLNLSGKPYTVIGVINPEFEYPFGQDIGSTVDLFVPAMMAGEAHPAGDGLFHDRSAHAFSIIGALKPGVTFEQAQADLDRVAERLAAVDPATNRDRGILVAPWHEARARQLRPPLLLLMIGALLVYLIGCFNVTNLILVRDAGRSRELAVRLALGAGKLSLARALGLEAVVLCVAAGAFGVLAAAAALPLLVQVVRVALRVSASSFPPDANIGMNPTVLLVAISATLSAALIATLLPAWRLKRFALGSNLSGGDRHGPGFQASRLRSGLVVFEIAAATVALAASILLTVTFKEMRARALGFDPSGVLSFRIALPTSKYAGDEAVARTIAQLQRSMVSRPEVTWAVPWGVGRPGQAIAGYSLVSPEAQIGDARDAPLTRAHWIGPGALNRIGISLLAGRDIAEADRAGGIEVAVVSSSLAERLWPGEDPLGRIVMPYSQEGGEAGWTVVGVAADASLGGRIPVATGEETANDIYLAAAQHPLQETYFLAGMDGEPQIEPIVEAVERVDRDIPVYEAAMIDDVLARPEGPLRFASLFMAVFGAVTLFLACLGVFGVMSYSVSQRTREIGLRAALGARPTDTLRLVLNQAARLGLAGVAIGTVLAFGFQRLLVSAVREVTQIDPLTLTLSAVLLIALALVAGALPAFRALRVAPLVALRE